MDKGAHFYKCDFQVHTPRDRQWNGNRAVTDTERKAYAEELVLACRQKGLNGIAITDHHDFAFYKYVKEAADAEVDEYNNPVVEEHRLVVFPGMELTLSSPPCQAILILDSNFPVNLLSQVYPVLGINQTDHAESLQADVSKLTCAQSFQDLYRVLNLNDFLKDRFIILPNVSEGGSNTILRAGFNAYYREMPCVGGYLDGDCSQLGTGNQNILSGRTRDYGPKQLGLFQTSDNRHRNYSLLGNSSTWVKWATPTAEAIRQACLAKESRISQSEPDLPSIYIVSIDISNSKFMGPVYLEFNRQYNALIGGRGTGKSSILEYLRWGVCDQLIDSSSSELPEYQVRRKKLIEKTLLPYEGAAQISFIKNNIKHIIKRKASSPELFLKIGDGEFELCKETDVRNLMPIQAYSQKQLSGVGVSVEELKRLIYSPIRQALDDFASRFTALSSDIRNCYELRRKKKQVEKEIAKSELELKSLVEQANSLKEGLKGMSESDRKIIESHNHYEEIDGTVEGWKSELLLVKDALDEFKGKIAGLPSEFAKGISLEASEAKIFEQIKAEIKSIFSELTKQSKTLDDLLSEDCTFQKEFNKTLKKWEAVVETHRKKYEEAKEKSSSHEVTIKQIKKIEDRITEINKFLRDKKKDIMKSGDPDIKFDDLKKQWCELHKERGNILHEQCAKLSGLSCGALRASLRRGKGISTLENAMKNILSGSNIRKDKIESLCNSIANMNDPVEEWTKFLGELEALADFVVEEDLIESIPQSPKLTAVGFNSKDIEKIAEKLTPEDWIDLFLVSLDDLPEFEYKAREGEYIDFADASAGQQATALMYVLLNQEGPPLVIDQPEDDLDNEMISSIARLIWDSKKKRQLIFASHNANIVVNGDAELVACCRYKVAGDQSKGEVEKQGAIDIPEIREEITKVMEGGEDAFKLRKEKYGF